MENTLRKLKLGKNKREERSWWQSQIFLLFIFAGVMTLVGWAAVSWMQVPYVHHSVSKDKAVAVFTANGRPLPLSPLPDRYEIINVQ
jgi:hypothetical protein